MPAAATVAAARPFERALGAGHRLGLVSRPWVEGNLLRASDIADRLSLSPTAPDDACAARLCGRKLSVEPILRPILDSERVSASASPLILAVLRDFRAAVRGLDDLLDASDTEPDGTLSAWRQFGPGVTAATCLSLWERAVTRARDAGAGSVILVESEAMLTAASLEETVQRQTREGTKYTIGELVGLEARIRDKELAYWRLIAGLIRPFWRCEEPPMSALQEELVRLADLWQRLDDARDFQEDLDLRRLSSFVVDALQSERSAELTDAFDWHREVSAIAEHAMTALRNRRLESLQAAADKVQTRIEHFRDGLAPPSGAVNTAPPHSFETLR